MWQKIKCWGSVSVVLHFCWKHREDNAGGLRRFFRSLLKCYGDIRSPNVCEMEKKALFWEKMCCVAQSNSWCLNNKGQVGGILSAELCGWSLSSWEACVNVPSMRSQWRQRPAAGYVMVCRSQGFHTGFSTFSLDCWLKQKLYNFKGKMCIKDWSFHLLKEFEVLGEWSKWIRERMCLKECLRDGAGSVPCIDFVYCAPCPVGCWGK